MSDDNPVMSDENPTKSNPAGWTPMQGYILGVVCLLIGMAGGYLTRGSSGQLTTAPGPNPQPVANAAPGPSQTTPQELQQALAQELPPLQERLKSDPNNAELLADVGNMYFDARRYDQAAPYYNRVLQLQPGNTAVRTDLGIAYWLLGNTDGAIAEFQKALKTAPTQANTLFNLGVVEWQGKMDAEAALAAWQKLLDTNPDFAGKDKVLQMMAQARRHVGVKPGTMTDKPAKQ